MKVDERLKQEERIIKEIKSSLSMVRTVTGKSPTYYASSPTSTGRRLYSHFKKHGVTSVKELEKKTKENFFRESIMSENIKEGESFGKYLQKNGLDRIIVPGTFFAEGWTQEHYISLWERVIVDCSDEIIFNTHWEYSDGCVQEFWIGLREGKTLRFRDSLNKEINVKDALKMIRKAINDVDKIGANANNLYNFYRRIDLQLSSNKTKR